jgi:hypothetical protein
MPRDLDGSFQQGDVEVTFDQALPELLKPTLGERGLCRTQAAEDKLPSRIDDRHLDSLTV